MIRKSPSPEKTTNGQSGSDVNETGSEGRSAEKIAKDTSRTETKSLKSLKRSRSACTDDPLPEFVISKHRRADESTDAIEGGSDENVNTPESEVPEPKQEPGETVPRCGERIGSEPGSSGDEADIDSCSGGSGSGECASRRAHKLRAAVVCQDGHVPPQDQQHEGDCMVASRLLQLWTVVPMVTERHNVGAQDTVVRAPHYHERVPVPC